MRFRTRELAFTLLPAAVVALAGSVSWIGALPYGTLACSLPPVPATAGIRVFRDCERDLIPSSIGDGDEPGPDFAVARLRLNRDTQ